MEKTVLLGGLATTGLVYAYLPLCDGNGTQVTFGICEELIKLCLKYGPGDISDNWKKQKNAPEEQRYLCFFSPASFMLALDEVLEEAGVDIWLDTLVCDAQVNSEDHLEAIEVENESGRGIIKANCFIDASGTGIVARRAGAEGFENENYLSVWTLEYDKVSQGTLAKNIKMLHKGCVPPRPGDMVIEPGIDGRKVSNFMLAGRKLLREHYQAEYDSGKADRKTFFPLKIPAMPQFRKIYAVAGMETLNSGQDSTFFKDSIGLVADWRKAGYVWEIPYRTLVPKKIKGLLTAGRCISSIGDAWEITRVIPAAALTGEVAGIAAAISIEQGITPDKLAINTLQTKLKVKGFPLHLQGVGLL